MKPRILPKSRHFSQVLGTSLEPLQPCTRKKSLCKKEQSQEFAITSKHGWKNNAEIFRWDLEKKRKKKAILLVNIWSREDWYRPVTGISVFGSQQCKQGCCKSSSVGNKSRCPRAISNFVKNKQRNKPNQPHDVGKAPGWDFALHPPALPASRERSWL